jgi:hypothetical protein
MLIHDQAITVCFDVDDTMRTEIELNELFDTESDGFTLIVPYALKADWRQLLSTRVHEYMVVPKFCSPYKLNNTTKNGRRKRILILSSAQYV